MSVGDAAGDHLEHQHGGAGLFERARFALQALDAVLGAALHLVAAELVHRLRRQADVRTDRHAAIDQKAHGLGHHLAAFELDHLRAGGQQARRVAQCLLGRFLEAAEGQVGNQEGAMHAARGAFGVIDHVLHGHRQRRGMALDHVAERVADQDDIHAAAFLDGGEARVVGREHDDLLAFGAHAAEFGQGGRPGVRQVVHARSFSRKCTTDAITRGFAARVDMDSVGGSY